jgi:hypothetical protein
LNVQIIYKSLISLRYYQGHHMGKVNPGNIWDRIERYWKMWINLFYYLGDCAPSISKQVPVTVETLCQILTFSCLSFWGRCISSEAESLRIIIHTEINLFWQQSVAGTNLHLQHGNFYKFNKLEILSVLATSFPTCTIFYIYCSKKKKRKRKRK